jgi:hypothetical protein
LILKLHSFTLKTHKMRLALLLIFSGLFTLNITAQNNVGIGTAAPDASSILDLSSSSKGFLAPRMTQAQRLAIAAPAAGLLVFDLTDGCYYYYNGQWNSLCQTNPITICPTATSGNIALFASPTDLCNSVFYQNGTNVGQNTSSPAVSFQINATDAIGVPAGNTAQQPAGAPSGALRFNTTLGVMEVFNGSCWQNVNTPPVGSTYIQWFNAADPNVIYPCTQWVASDIANGEFIRAAGGASNVAAGGALTGVLQANALEDHTHAVNGTANGSGILNTSSDGAHTHDWGGWWSNDDSRDYTTTAGNGDGNGNTLSDNVFWWGGNPGTTGNPNPEFATRTSTTNGNHNHTGTTSGANAFSANIYIPYDDNLSADVRDLSMNDNPTQCGAGWDGRHTVGNFMGRLSDGCMGHNHTIPTDGNHNHSVDFYAHRHFIKLRATSSAGAHTHTIADHTHTLNLTGGNIVTGSSATETRPDNVAVIFWRRTN